MEVNKIPTHGAYGDDCERLQLGDDGYEELRNSPKCECYLFGFLGNKENKESDTFVGFVAKKYLDLNRGVKSWGPLRPAIPGAPLADMLDFNEQLLYLFFIEEQNKCMNKMKKNLYNKTKVGFFNS